MWEPSAAWNVERDGIIISISSLLNNPIIKCVLVGSSLLLIITSLLITSFPSRHCPSLRAILDRRRLFEASNTFLPRGISRNVDARLSQAHNARPTSMKHSSTGANLVIIRHKLASMERNEAIKRHNKQPGPKQTKCETSATHNRKNVDDFKIRARGRSKNSNELIATSI